MKIKVFIGVLLAAFVTGLFFAAVPVKAADPIKIGAILPMADSTGIDGSKSMQLAVKHINEKGGLLGREVKLILMDDEGKPDKAAAALDKLVTVDNVDVITGGVGSGTTMAMIPGMKKYGKVVVWAGAASSKVEQAMEGQDWFFHIHGWDYQQQAAFDKGYRELFPKVGGRFEGINYFVAYEEGPFGAGSFKVFKPLAEAAKQNLQGEAFKSAFVGGGDYRSVLRHAKDFKAEMFTWLGYANDAIPIMEQAKEIGFAPAVFAGSPPGWPKDFAKSPLSDGVLFNGYWSESIGKKNKESKAYSEAFSKEFKDSPVTYFGPLCYTNIMIVAEAIKRAKTLEKAALIKALEATKYASPMGDTYIFGKSNVINHQAYASPKLLQYQKGKQEVVWPFEAATAKMIYPFPAWDKRDKDGWAKY